MVIIMKRSIKKYAPIFLLPITIAFLFAFAVPFVMGVGLSFADFTTVTDAKWVGFQNYINAFMTTALASVVLSVLLLYVTS